MSLIKLNVINNIK